MKRIVAVSLSSLLVFAAPMFAERINQEGRILGPLPVVTNALLFNTSNADAVVSAVQIFPVTNAWNEDISHRPVLTNSDPMIAQISADLLSTRRTLRVFPEMNFVLVPDNQPVRLIHFLDYPDESDLDGGTNDYGLYPVPANMPVEGWPSETGGLTLEQWQEDVNDTGGDRHSIIVKPGAGFIWETWQAKRVGTNWEASNGAKFDLKNNALRPAGWTSGDAAGLPMFPALPRYDECQRGMVEHACRIVVKRTRYNTTIYPATHYASWPSNSSPNIPAMGQRLRLKSSFVIPVSWTPQEKALLLGLKKYGAIVADNGGFFSISITPDDRWPANAFSHISSIGITNFEAIQTTGPNEGPRSPGAPGANAGSDGSVPMGQPAPLQGVVNYTGTPPVIVWKLYSGPGAVTFGNAAQTNTTATFSAPGVYTLMLSADDGVHAVAYDAVVFTVSDAINLSISGSGPNVNLNWTGGSAPWVVEKTAELFPPSWSGVITTSSQNASVPITNAKAFFRVRGN